ncbi:MAG: porphobilinogen synthase [Candidatus Thermoplasmatota archaeon]|nr:porphobilinogen synthase [Candidatus Thermoplasmatota archaeon]
MSAGQFPYVRMRRLRREGIRQLLSSVSVRPSSLMYPVFVDERLREKQPIQSMPGQFRYSIGDIPALCEEMERCGIGAAMVFGLPETKDDSGSGAYGKDGIVQKAVRAIKENSSIAVATVCTRAAVTPHGHCGIVKGGSVDNDATLEIYGRIAVSQAAAGADIVAPSGMMDGQVASIRKALDAEGFTDTAILAYSAKAASSFYGPFREAAESSPSFGDRRTYQLNFASGTEHIREIELDIAEGADIVMVKPALTALDMVRRARELFNVPVAAYNVSGEYSMVKAAALNGWIDYRGAVTEILTSIFRAGADMVVTYHALEVAGWMKGEVV